MARLARFSQNSTVKPRNAGVKGGCKTCRIRKIKCDRSWPACTRCLSTGRSCDGYGIWGGGGNGYSQHADHISPSAFSSSSSSSSPARLLQLFGLNTEENIYMSWYAKYTALKMPGVFVSCFWDKLLLQASSTEPAALHALLTLSAAHKKEAQGSGKSEEFFALRQYDQASKQLRKRMAAQLSFTTQVTLIVCLVLIQLECIRDNVDSAVVHLQHGMKLVNEIKKTDVDDGIVRALRSYFLQAKLIGFDMSEPWPLNLIPEPVVEFSSTIEARQGIERNLLLLITLQDVKESMAKARTGEQIRVELERWQRQYRRTDINHYDLLDRFAFRLLHVYWIMAKIMLASLFGGDDALDYRKEEFKDIVMESIELFKKAFGAGMQTVRIKKGMEKAHSIADMGWIVPLYYTSIKCRVPRLRAQSLRMFGAFEHKEGLCSAKLLTIIASQVKLIEERGKFDALQKSFPLLNQPNQDDMMLFKVPRKRRIHEIRVSPPTTSEDCIGLCCFRKEAEKAIKVWSGYYDLVSQQWNET